MPRKFYNFETGLVVLRNALRNFLHDSRIYYELSGVGDAFHFEIKCNPEEVEKVNAFLDACYATA